MPTDDIESLADRLRLLLTNPAKTLEMGSLGRQRVEQLFSIEKEAAGIEAVYDKLWQQSGELTA